MRQQILVLLVVTTPMVAPIGRAAIVEFTVELDGIQAGTDSVATGSGTSTLNTETKKLEWLVTFEQAALTDGAGSATAAHFHRGASGVNGPVIDPPGGLTIHGGQLLFGSTVLNDADLSDFMAGRVYVNVHSSAFPAGEIRGQVIPESVELASLRDNTLYENSSGALSNGMGQHLFAGQIRSGELRRGLVAFDLAGAGIPAGAKITHVEFSANVSRSVSGDHDMTLHRVLADWGEGNSDASGAEGKGTVAGLEDATWLHTFFDSETWATPGGDFMEDASASVPVGGAGAYLWGSTAGMVADVQAWVDDPASNFGWLIKGNENATSSAKRLDSRENPDEEKHPSLFVKYTPPCAFNLAGDLNGDCKVDFLDVALLLESWQVDCNKFPLDPACVAK